jgi:uncharacterized repeat protein (TIGR03803 family)
MLAGTAYTTFDGVSVAPASILVKYTYPGDTNLDGVVNGGDYTRIDDGFVSKLTGWSNGDVNYDGIINGSDYTLLDNVYNQQNSTLNSAGFTLKILASFNYSTTGQYIYAGLTLSSNQSTLYGVTYLGGTNTGGTVFSEPVAGGTASVIASLNNSLANSPYYSQASLILYGGVLYGTASGGDSNSDGTVFSVTTAGTVKVLASFNGTNGSDPQARLVVSSNGSTLYGTTSQGGANGLGTVFSVPTAGGTITDLASFSGANEADCRSPLILSGSTLYGTTQGTSTVRTPTAYDGTVFSISTSAVNSTVTVLATFNNSNGASPISDLVLANGILYGTASEGGPGGQGTVFSLPIAGGNPATLASFNGSNGGDVGGGLLLLGSTLYGDTYGLPSSSNPNGTVFSVPITGGNPTTIATFNGSGSGENPICDLVADSNGILYGTTDNGGANGDGTIFSLTPIPVP